MDRGLGRHDAWVDVSRSVPVHEDDQPVCGVNIGHPVLDNSGFLHNPFRLARTEVVAEYGPHFIVLGRMVAPVFAQGLVRRPEVAEDIQNLLGRQFLSADQLYVCGHSQDPGTKYSHAADFVVLDLGRIARGLMGQLSLWTTAEGTTYSIGSVDDLRILTIGRLDRLPKGRLVE
jgi:hypothetical protein